MLTTTPTFDTAAVRYIEPGRFTRRVFNPLVARLTRVGISLAGSRVLTVAGRKSGAPRSTVVNVLTLDGQRYLVAPRVEPVVATELDDDEKLPVLRAYLERWKWEVGQFFDDLDHRSGDDRLREVAPGFPAFRLTAPSRGR